MTRHLIRSSLALALLLPVTVAAQAPVTVSNSAFVPGRNATRVELEAASTQFDRLAASPAYSERARASARAQAQQLRQRLTEGDFRFGERLLIRVEGSVNLDDTVTVQADQRISVRGIRVVSLAGVLRSELERKLLGDLTEVVRNATVTARPILRVAVFGLVTRPGYQSVPGETTLDQLITLAGGPAATAAAENSTVLRGDEVLFDREQVRAAVVRGQTIDALGVQDGDALMVPLRGPGWDRSASLQWVTILIGPLMTIFLISR